MRTAEGQHRAALPANKFSPELMLLFGPNTEPNARGISPIETGRVPRVQIPPPPSRVSLGFDATPLLFDDLLLFAGLLSAALLQPRPSELAHILSDPFLPVLTDTG